MREMLLSNPIFGMKIGIIPVFIPAGKKGYPKIACPR